MPRKVIVGRTSGGLPFEHDLLSQDLDTNFPKFTGGRTVHWGLLIGAVAGSWDEEVNTQGIDWCARFALPGTVKVPFARKQRLRSSWRSIKQHCLLVAVDTGKTTLNEARDIGRPVSRALVGLFRREVPVIRPADVLWEGAIVPIRQKLRMSAVGLTFAPKEAIGPNRLYKLGLRMAKISGLALPSHLRLALEWLALARAARVRSEMFIHLWLAIVTLAAHGQGRREGDMKRMRTYVQSMITGPGVVSQAIIDQLLERLRRMEEVRNDLVHRADDSSVTEQLLRKLEEDAFFLVDFELGKLGTPIAA